MELRPNRERRLPRRYHSDGTRGDTSPPLTTCTPFDNKGSTILLTQSSASYNTNTNAAVPHSTLPHTQPLDIEDHSASGTELSNDEMAKRQPAKKGLAYEDEVKLGFRPGTYTGTPAAFPSLDMLKPPSQDTPDSYTLNMLVNDRASHDADLTESSLVSLKDLWDCKAFPDSMDERERKWYRDVEQKVKDLEGSCTIHFTTLYPSLRKVIIDSIRDMTISATFVQSVAHPVRTLLRLNTDTLRSIDQENEDFCPTGDECHIRAWKERHPGEPIDPDLPPPNTVVKAIRYLRQERLPGCLLGEWQYSLPEAMEACHETDLAECTLDAFGACRHKETETRNKNSLVVAISVTSKCLARLGSVCNFAHGPSPAETRRAISKTLTETSQEDTDTTSEITTEPPHALAAGPVLQAPSLSSTSKWKKRQRSALESSKGTADTERPSNAMKRNPPALPQWLRKPLKAPKIYQRKLQKPTSVPGPVSSLKPASLSAAVPTDVAQCLQNSYRMNSIEDDSDGLDSLFEEPIDRIDRAQTYIKDLGRTGLDTYAQNKSSTGISQRRQELAGSARSKQTTETSAVGSKPSPTAKSKPNKRYLNKSRLQHGPAGVAKPRDDTQRRPQSVDSTYPNKKRRLNTTLAPPSIKHVSLNQKVRNIDKNDSATPPLHFFRGLTHSSSAATAMRPPLLVSVTSKPFMEDASQDYKCLSKSTYLSRAVSDQGVSLHLHKEPRTTNKRSYAQVQLKDDHEHKQYKTEVDYPQDHISHFLPQPQLHQRSKEKLTGKMSIDRNCALEHLQQKGHQKTRQSPAIAARKVIPQPQQNSPQHGGSTPEINKHQPSAFGIQTNDPSTVPEIRSSNSNNPSWQQQANSVQSAQLNHTPAPHWSTMNAYAQGNTSHSNKPSPKNAVLSVLAPTTFPWQSGYHSQSNLSLPRVGLATSNFATLLLQSGNPSPPLALASNFRQRHNTQEIITSTTTNPTKDISSIRIEQPLTAQQAMLRTMAMQSHIRRLQQAHVHYVGPSSAAHASDANPSSDEPGNARRRC